jgi:hypothetical protein
LPSWGCSCLLENTTRSVTRNTRSHFYMLGGPDFINKLTGYQYINFNGALTLTFSFQSLNYFSFSKFHSKTKWSTFREDYFISFLLYSIRYSGELCSQ